MGMRRAFLTAAFLAGAWIPSVSAEERAKPLVTMEMFWKHCSQREHSEVSMAFCRSYISGFINSSIHVYELFGGEGGSGYCMKDASMEELVESVLRQMPIDYSKAPAADVLSAAVISAMQCDD